MAELDLSGNAWDSRYKSNDIGWDLGVVSPPLKEYIDQLKDQDKDKSILIPGGGNSYEAEYLFQKGFQNVFVVDVSQTALENLQQRVPVFPKDHLILGNFFDVNRQFDLVLEQTFFCAIHPSLREKYAKKMHQLLNPHGKLVGVLFKVPLFSNRPPFGGSKKEYVNYFESKFHFETFESCYNSHPSRQGKELFINFTKK
ncbi:MAG: SAM-dependent methyltransferase [Flavobacteriaceae bacterium]|nr:SAM-dependent methyltransferase [Flavobacteriaceae bacterium]|tara:strand:- start:180547 stop:181143 length:597 start_codon:yes stop_codon:yes gene_type:complete